MKNNSFISGSLITVLLLFSSSNFAQDKLFARKGVVELNGNISFSSYTIVSNGKTGNTTSIFTFAPQIGYFISDGFEIGLGTGISLIPGISVISPEGGNNSSLVQLFFSPSYNISTENKNLYPFLEAQLGYTSTSSGNSTSSGFSYGGRGGFKLIAKEHLLFTFSIQYLAITLDESGATERNGLNYFTIGIGISGYL